MRTHECLQAAHLRVPCEVCIMWGGARETREHIFETPARRSCMVSSDAPLLRMVLLLFPRHPSAILQQCVVSSLFLLFTHTSQAEPPRSPLKSCVLTQAHLGVVAGRCACWHLACWPPARMRRRKWPPAAFYVAMATPSGFELTSSRRMKDTKGCPCSCDHPASPCLRCRGPMTTSRGRSPNVLGCSTS